MSRSLKETATLSNSKWAEQKTKERSELAAAFGELGDSPIFTWEAISALDVAEVSADEDFKDTNLSSVEGKSIFELSQSKLEKLLLWITGFTRDKRFISMRESVVTSEISVQDLKEEIEENVNYFYQQNANLTLRVHGKTNGTSKPLRNLSPGDKNYLKIKSGKLMLKLDDGKWLTFEPGQKLRMFPRPVSVDRDMFELNPKKNKSRDNGVIADNLDNGEKKKKIKKINMGGGFTCRLDSFDVKAVRDRDGEVVGLDKIFTLSFYFITNNGEPRDIGSNSKKHPESNLTIKVKEENGHFVVVNGDVGGDLKESIDSQDMKKVLGRVAGNIVSRESGALFKLFSVLLNLYPKNKSHLIQGFYSIEHDEDNDEYLFGDTIFDYGSYEERQIWHPESTNTTLRKPSMLLQLVYEKLYVAQKLKLSPQNRLILAHLAMSGYLFQFPTFEQFKKLLPNIESKLKGAPSISEAIAIIDNYLRENIYNFTSYMDDKFVCDELTADEPILNIVDLARNINNGVEANDVESEYGVAEIIGIARKETNKIIESLLGERKYMNNSAESLFGRLMWVATRGSKNIKAVEGYEGVYEYKYKYKHEGENRENTVIILSQGDYKIGFLVEDGKIINLEDDLLKNAKSYHVTPHGKDNVEDSENRRGRFKAIRKIASDKLGLQIPTAMMRYVLD